MPKDKAPTVEDMIAAMPEFNRQCFFEICKIIAESDDPTLADKIAAEALRLLEEQEKFGPRHRAPRRRRRKQGKSTPGY